MSSNYYTTEGIVLKKEPRGEADAVATLITHDFGKIDVKIKSGRKATSKLGPHIDMGHHVRVSFVKNGDRVPTLIDAEIINRLSQWAESEKNFETMNRVFKVVNMLVPHEARDQKLFSLLVNFLESSTRSGRDFLKLFFEHEGYGSRLNIAQFGEDAAQELKQTLMPRERVV